MAALRFSSSDALTSSSFRCLRAVRLAGMGVAWGAEVYGRAVERAKLSYLFCCFGRKGLGLCGRVSKLPIPG